MLRVRRQAQDEDDREWDFLKATKKRPHPELVEGRLLLLQETLPIFGDASVLPETSLASSVV
jgi:hypothetical protein